MRLFKGLLFTAALLLISQIAVFAQVSGYTFAESAETYAVLGGTNSTATGDDGTQNGIPIGFNFNMGGTVYTHFCISTNGWIRLGDAATTIGSFSFSNSMGNTATHRPLIAALWDDNHRNTGAITYLKTGAPGSQVLTVDWNNVNIGGGGATSATNLASYQIKIYETTNVVEIIYGTLATAGTLSASVGLNDTTSFLSVTPGAPGTVSSATANNAIASVGDLAGKKLSFAPPSGPGTLQFSATAYSGSEGQNSTITVNRVGGQTGAVSVNYATSDGSASSADYTSVSGTLSWGDNDSSPKTFTLPLLSDGVSDPGETVTLTLSSPVGTTISGTNPVTFTIDDVPPPLTIPYSQDFESGAGGWITGVTIGAATDWVLGTPAKIQIAAAHSGANAWVTQLTADYTASTTSTLRSPNFDFSALTGRPSMSFWHNFLTEPAWDSGVLEYSIDGGANWVKVDGAVGSGGTFDTATSTGWYNSSSTSGSATGITPPKWSGTSTAYTGNSAGWIQSTTLLPTAVVGQPDVRFRFVFGGDSSTQDEGWAIDDIVMTPPTPGVVQFSGVSFAGNEGTVATISVTRTSGDSGAITVDYATSDGTANGGGVCGSVDYVSTSGTLSWASGDATPKTFTVQLCNDAVVDPAEVVNIALSNITGGATIGANNPATLTITDVPPPFSGNFTVGVGGNYPTLTNAGGLFEAINLAGATGPITIDIVSDIVGETGANALNPIAGDHALTIRPEGVPRTISGTGALGIIRINGADNITIDGLVFTSTVVGGNADVRGLTIRNDSTSTNAGVILVHSGADGASNNVLKNLVVEGNDPTTTFVGIGFGGATAGSLATIANNGNRVENCSVRKSVFGIVSLGVSSAVQNTGTVITENNLTGTGADRVRRVGIYVNFENGIQLTQNSVGGMDSAESNDAVGIAVGVQGVTASSTTAGGVSGAFIARNKVNGVQHTNTFSAVGILIAGAAGSTNTAQNNMVTGVISNSTLGDLVAGMFVVGGNTTTTNLYYNAVSMTGDRGTLTAETDQYPSYALAVTGTDPLVVAKNNIFATTQVANMVDSPDAFSYAIGIASAAFTNLDSNHNLFYSSGTSDGGFRTVSLADTGGTNSVDLTAWQASVTDDANSLEGDPQFLNPLNDLHSTVGSPGRDAGIAVRPSEQIETNAPMLVIDDFDGDSRGAGIPDIGADEIVPTASSASIAGRVMTAEGRGIRNVVIEITGGGLQQPVRAITGSFGYYRFEEIEVGEVYTITVSSKRFTFNPATRVITPVGDLLDFDFVAESQDNVKGLR